MTALLRCRVASRIVSGVVRATAPHLCAAPACFPTLPPCSLNHPHRREYASSAVSAGAVGDLIRSRTTSDALALVAVHQVRSGADAEQPMMGWARVSVGCAER